MKYTTTVALFALLAGSGCESETATVVGADGGVVTSRDGRFALDIPAGALSSDVGIGVEAVPCGARGSVGDCYEVTPRGTAFSFPVEVQWELADMELDGLVVTDLMLVAERDAGWSVLADRDVDLEDELLTASTGYLSCFAVVARPVR